MVEVAGIEPASETWFKLRPTCVVFVFSLKTRRFSFVPLTNPGGFLTKYTRQFFEADFTCPLSKFGTFCFLGVPPQLLSGGLN